MGLSDGRLISIRQAYILAQGYVDGFKGKDKDLAKKRAREAIAPYNYPLSISSRTDR